MFDLLHPPHVARLPSINVNKLQRAVVSELKETVPCTKHTSEGATWSAAVLEHCKDLAERERLAVRARALRTEFGDVFEPIPHVDGLPSDITCQIQLKEASKQIATRTYGSPRKFKDAWATLIQQHLDAGRIRVSNSRNHPTHTPGRKVHAHRRAAPIVSCEVATQSSLASTNVNTWLHILLSLSLPGMTGDALPANIVRLKYRLSNRYAKG